MLVARMPQGYNIFEANRLQEVIDIIGKRATAHFELRLEIFVDHVSDGWQKF